MRSASPSTCENAMWAPVSVACRKTGRPTKPSAPTVAISTGGPSSDSTTSENTPDSGKTTDSIRSPWR